MIECADYQIGLTQVGMVRLPDRGVPDPFTPPFNQFAVLTTNGDGLVRGDGYSNWTWTWPSLAIDQLQRLRAFVPANTASVKLFARTRLNDGTFATFYATMADPILSGSDGTPAEQDVPVFTGVTVHFTHAIAV